MEQPNLEQIAKKKIELGEMLHRGPADDAADLHAIRLFAVDYIYSFLWAGDSIAEISTQFAFWVLSAWRSAGDADPIVSHLRLAPDGRAILVTRDSSHVMDNGTVLEIEPYSQPRKIVFDLSPRRSDIEVQDFNNDVDSNALLLTAQGDGSFYISGPDLFPRKVTDGNVVSVCGYPIRIRTDNLDDRNERFAELLKIATLIDRSWNRGEYIPPTPIRRDLARILKASAVVADEFTKVNITNDVFDAKPEFELSQRAPGNDGRPLSIDEIPTEIRERMKADRREAEAIARPADDLIRGPIVQNLSSVTYYDDADATSESRRCDNCKRYFLGPAKIDARNTFCDSECQSEFSAFNGTGPAVVARPPIADPDETKAINEQRIAAALGDVAGECPHGPNGCDICSPAKQRAGLCPEQTNCDDCGKSVQTTQTFVICPPGSAKAITLCSSRCVARLIGAD